MNIRAVEPTHNPYNVQCSICGAILTVSLICVPVYADLDGETFRAYYCPECIPEKGEDNGNPSR